MSDKTSDKDLSPADIIAEARGAVASLGDATRDASHYVAREVSPSASIPRTREEHLKRATGSFEAVEAGGASSAASRGRGSAAAGSRAGSSRGVRGSRDAWDARGSHGAQGSQGARGSQDARSAQGANNPRARKAEAARTKAAAEAQDVAGAIEAARSGAAVARAKATAEKTSDVVAGAQLDEAAHARTGEKEANATARFQASVSKRPKRAEAEVRAARRGKVLVAFGVSVLVVVVALAAVLGGFSFYRWFSADDAADFQGSWYIAGTDTPITITEQGIVLTAEVTFRYELDSASKTIVFTSGGLRGEGHYRFSIDRQQLAVMEGSSTWWDTLRDDFGWTLSALVALAQGEDASPASGSDVTLLSRVSASEAAAGAGAGADADAGTGADATGPSADVSAQAGGNGLLLESAGVGADNADPGASDAAGADAAAGGANAAADAAANADAAADSADAADPADDASAPDASAPDASADAAA